MAQVDIKTFDIPDETIPAGDKVRLELVNAGGIPVYRAVFEPGWRYSQHADPGNLCPAPHGAYIVSGRLHILMDDGSEAEAGPGTVVAIEPGHDAWTVGDEPCVFIDFGATLAPFADQR